MKSVPKQNKGVKMLFNNMIIDDTYQIVEEIGRGGMGVIYLAYHLRLQKYIVLKKIKNPYADISMLRNEVDILKSLHHPYLPQVYDFIEFEGGLYTVIDYIDGYDFNYYINNGYIFQEGQLIKWLRQLCEVLDYLHSQTPRILHTDIKPGNIIITANGDICLIDFGISLYNTDVIKGLSENYSSPEQYGNYQYLQYGIGEYCQLDERTDIYSLGATFYHIMTGFKPGVINMDMPDISQYNMGYSDVFVDIIRRSMEFDINRRYKSAGDMLKAIDSMKKHDSRYKKYLIVQFCSSFVAAIIIVIGVLMIINGYNQEVLKKYETEYSNFISLTKNGDASGAASAGESILSNSEYNGIIQDGVKAQILHKIGDGYFDDEDYYNAAYFYKNTLDCEKTELYYRDYVFSLICDGQIDRAEEVIAEIRTIYPDSSVIAIANAQLCYKNREYLDAIKIVDSNLTDLSKDVENMYSANIIKGDSYNALENFGEAASAYEQALNGKETPTVLRKLGNAYLKYADKSSDTITFKKAMECFKKINESHTANVDDVVNLAQACMLSADSAEYNVCKQILSEASERYEDCRIYIMLAILSDATDDINAESYCREAYRLYKNLSDDEKAMISSESLKEIKRLYKVYCGQDW